MVAVLAACGGAGSQGGSQGGDPVRVGVIVKDNTNPFMISVQDGAKAADSRLDAAEVMVDAARTETDIDDQIAKVEAMMSRGVQVLAIAPNAPQLEPVLDRAVNQGIDVMLIDSDIPGWDGETTLIGTDNRKASKVAVEQMAEEMGGEGKMGVVGIPGIPVVDERVDGARDAIEDTQIEIVQEVNGQSDQQVALNVTEDMLRRNPDLAAIWAPSGNNGLGAVRAAELAGKSDDILIYSFDGTEAELESVKAGKLDGSVAQRPEEMGELAVETALEVARGRDVAPEINTGFDVVTEENVDEFLKK
jgi:ribose transport system substrate-binding protein